MNHNKTEGNITNFQISSILHRKFFSIIKLRQIINLWDTYKSRYFAITEFNNCFIIRSPSFFFQSSNHSRPVQGSARSFFVVSITQEQTIICKLCGELSANERKKTCINDNMFLSILSIVSLSLVTRNGKICYDSEIPLGTWHGRGRVCFACGIEVT